LYAFIDKHGIQDDPKNGQLLGGLIIDQWGRELDPVTLEAATKHLRDQLTWVSANAREYNRVMSELTPENQELVGRWFKSTRLVSDGEQGRENTLLLIGWLRRNNYLINWQGLNAAMEAWIPTGQQSPLVSSKQTLHWKEVQAGPRTEYNGMRNHALDPVEEKKDPNAGLYDSRGRKNWAEVERIEREKKAKENPAPVTDAWEKLCRGMLNHGTHGQKNAAKEVFDRGIAAGKQFREIYSEMDALKRSYERMLPTSRF
jgi:hypothetical protein